MTPARPRIDLDGLALFDAEAPNLTLAIFRRRARGGLVLQLPESGDVVVGWEEIEEASIDLASGALRVRFAAAFVLRNAWVRGARELSGRWLDRLTLD